MNVLVNCSFSEAILVKLKTIFSDCFNMLFNITELFECLSVFSQTIMCRSTLEFKPESLHFVHVKLAAVKLFGEKSHHFKSFANLVVFEKVLTGECIQVSVCLIKHSSFID